MDKLYLRGVVDNLQPVLVEFDKQCAAHGIKYIILTDEPNRQTFEISNENRELVQVITAFADKHGIVVENVGRTLDFAYGSPHSDDSTYGLDLIDDDVRFKIGESVIGYLGHRHGPLIRENMQGLMVPIKKINTETLWKTHLNHPRYAELGDDKSCYTGVLADFPPLVVDTLDEGAPVKHAGVLVDGFRRLYASYYRKEPEIKAVDVADVVSGVQDRLGIKLEDQYKSPSRRMIQKQSSFRSSFGKTKSFGGVSGYNGKGKYPKTMEECNIGEVGKLKGDLLAHDNKTIVPKGTIVKVVDGDAGLPDIKYDGKIVNVDREALEDTWKETTFAQQLEAALIESKMYSTQHDNPHTDLCAKSNGEGYCRSVGRCGHGCCEANYSKHMRESKVEKSEFENSISSILGIISVVEPEILLTITPDKK